MCFFHYNFIITVIIMMESVSTVHQLVTTTLKQVEIICVCVCVCVCACACVRACARARACARVCISVMSA